MSGEGAQSIVVVFIVLAAVAYLVLRARRMAKRGGCCGDEGACGANTPGPEAAAPKGAQPYVPANRLAERARQIAEKRKSAEA